MSTPFDEVALRLADADNVGVLTRDLTSGTTLVLPDGCEVGLSTDVPAGHKVALAPIAAGESVVKYGQFIGTATRDIAPGDHVHTHNLGFEPGVRLGHRPPASAVASEAEPRTFLGYRRSDGRVGTRNYIGIVTSVNCSASTATLIADQFRHRDIPGIDGVVAFTHDSGCGLVPSSEGAQITRRTLWGHADHPNIVGVLVLGLGCEMLAAQTLLEGIDLRPEVPVTTLTIQDTGGIRATVRAGIAAIEEMIDGIGVLERQPVPVSALVLGTNCGGSDGYSGITANPALGLASDRIVASGGTAILAETPEVFGAEHLLIDRAVSEEVAEKLRERLRWWDAYMTAGGGTLDNNPSPGNKAGGLTTILEKSLGAVAKSGSAPLSAVVEYAERVPVGGLVFMDTPGYDPVSVTGIVAGGANVVVFTTGRGSVLGCKPTPSIKVSTNSETYRRMSEDMDLDAGRIVTGEASLQEVGDELFELILRVASGEETASEELDLGADEFVPWQLGAVT